MPVKKQRGADSAHKIVNIKKEKRRPVLWHCLEAVAFNVLQ
jgi:hypothetical protein